MSKHATKQENTCKLLNELHLSRKCNRYFTPAELSLRVFSHLHSLVPTKGKKSLVQTFLVGVNIKQRVLVRTA